MASPEDRGEPNLSSLSFAELGRDGGAVPFARASLNRLAACHPEDANLKSFDELGCLMRQRRPPRHALLEALLGGE